MKHYLYTLIILALFSCSKDEPEKPNTPPKAFEVTAKVEGTDVTLTWTDAVDADGDAVTYAVVYGDTLAKGLTAKTYTIKNLPYETEIAGTVVASDGKGGKTESGFKVKTSESIYVNIPDVEFEKFLLEEGIDDILDGKVLKENAFNVLELDIGKYQIRNNEITSLEGLEVFLNLESLSILTSKLKELSLKGLVNLKSLSVYDSGLEKVDVSFSPKLESIGVGSSKMSELNTYNNPELKWLVCAGENFRILNLENNTELSYLFVQDADNFSVDLSKNVKLAELNFVKTNLEVCDLSNNVKLTRLRIVETSKVLDIVLPKHSPLDYLELNNVDFGKIDLSNYITLTHLIIESSNIETINLQPLSNLSYLSLPNNSLKSINLSQNQSLGQINLYNNRLTELILCNNLEIWKLDCQRNSISTIYINKSNKWTSSWKKDPTATYKVCD